MEFSMCEHGRKRTIMKEPDFAKYCRRLHLPEAGMAYLRDAMNSDAEPISAIRGRSVGVSPGEEVAREYGFRYRVVSSAELDSIFTRNITFMADYFDERVPEPDPRIKAQLIEVVGKRVGISIRELLDLCPGTKPEEIYAVIGRRYVFVDLSQAPLVDWDKTLCSRA